MTKTNPRSTLRSLVSTVFFCALVFSIVIVALLVGNLIRKHNSRSEYRELRAELDNDPIAARLRSDSEQRCVPSGREYYWLCGVVIEASPSLPYGYCSTPDRPLYFGALDEASQADLSLGDLKFEHAIRVSDVGISPTNSETPYAYPHVFPPKEIFAHEPELMGDTSNVYYSWVNYQGLPVLFASGSRSWKLTPEERANLPVGVGFKHPDFPLRISRSMPISEIADWKHFVDTAISEVSKSVTSYEVERSCSQPPETVRFLYNIYNTGKLKALRDWVKEHHNP